MEFCYYLYNHCTLLIHIRIIAAKVILDLIRWPRWFYINVAVEYCKIYHIFRNCAMYYIISNLIGKHCFIIVEKKLCELLWFSQFVQVYLILLTCYVIALSCKSFEVFIKIVHTISNIII